jgi:tetratricopeptide (TPR) repeat protein
MKLTVSRGDTRDRQIELAERDLRIGRGPDNDLVLEDPDKGVSRLHAELRFQNGHYIIIDLNSQNGTWVEGQRVPRAVIEPNVPIVIGPYRLVLESDQPAKASDTLVAKAIAPSTPPPLKSKPAKPAARPQVQRSGDPVAWLARQPKPVIFGGFVVIVILVMALSQIFGPSSQESGSARSSQSSAAPPPSVDNKKIMADHLAAARALIDRGDQRAAIAEHLEPILLIEPEHGEALDLKARAELALSPPGNPTPAVPPATTPVPSTPSAPPVPATAAAQPETPPPAPKPTPVSRAAPERYVPTVARRAGESTSAWQARDRRLKEAYDQAKLSLTRSAYESAARSFEALLGEEPNYRDAADLLARAKTGISQARTDAAERAVDAAAKLEKAGDLAAALQEYERARQLDPQRSGLDHTMARLKDQMKTGGEDAYKRARQYDAAGRLPEAVALYERALKLLPPDHPSRPPAKERLELLRTKLP